MTVRPIDYLLAALTVLVLAGIVWFSIQSGNVPPTLPVCSPQLPASQPCYIQ